MSKPRGQIPIVHLDPTTKDAWYEAHGLPTSKADLEYAVARAAWAALQSTDWSPFANCSPPERNHENDFDFAITCPSQETQYLELMEVAPLDLIQGSYDRASQWYGHGDMADWIAAKVRAKAERYAPGPHVHLLLYSTDWRFVLSNSIHWLLVYYLDRVQSRFSSILYLPNPAALRTPIELLWPRRYQAPTPELEAAARKRMTYMFDLAAAEVMPDGSVVVPAMRGKELGEGLPISPSPSSRNSGVRAVIGHIMIDAADRLW